MATKKTSKGQPQSAKSGRYVTKKYADKHPATTFAEGKKKKR